MHIIYLAGNSLNNKKWIEKVKSIFDSFSTGDILYYDHWETGDKWINLDTESKKITDLIKDKTDYLVFSKSIGSVLALKNIFEGTLKPSKIIVCGHPFKSSDKKYLTNLQIPAVFIQNEFDPVYSFADLKNTLTENSPVNYQLIKIPDNNTHDYEDFKKLSKLVSRI